MILDSIMGHISTVNADGLKQYKAAQVAKAGKSGATGVPGYKMGQSLKDDLFTFGGLADKGMRDAQGLVSEISSLLTETRIPEGERQVLFAQKVPEYRQKVVDLIKDQMSPSERGKLQTREEVFDLFKNNKEVVDRNLNPDQLREAFINTYGNAGIFYDNDPFDIDITDAYAVSNAFFDLADISTDAKNYYKNQLEGMRRSGEVAQQQRAQNPSGAARFNPSN